MNLPPGKYLYFLSDAHLGIDAKKSSREREKLLVQFLDEIAPTAAAIYIVGDLFDFWYEYRTVVPRGYTRILGKLAGLADGGIPIHIFTGNHDMWMFGYFTREFDATLHRQQPIRIICNNKIIEVGHGDGLGPGDRGYKFIKAVFANKLCIKLFGMLHPNWGIGLANYFSGRSREANHRNPLPVTDVEKEFLVAYCRESLKHQHTDYFIFGHRHVAGVYPLQPDATYINLGDWITYFTYAVFDGTQVQLKEYAPALR